jgi:Transcriptional regulatory protein, C terminal
VTATEGRREELPFVGRVEELAFLERLTTGPAPSITFVSGIGGIGKSWLLDAFARRRQTSGVSVVRIDCRLVEPTEAGFYRELSRAAGGDITSCDDATWRLKELGSVVLLFDDVDALRLLDAWLRSAFVPALPSNAHVIFSGRDAPLSAWLQVPWYGTLRALELSPLDDADALSLLTAAGVPQARAVRVNRIARGHPLALTLAAITLQNIDDAALEDLAFHRIVDELARRHLAEIADPITRRVVEAASLLRNVTAPLLGTMLPDLAPSDAYERLRALPLIQLSREGLKLHDAVRDAIAGELRSSDPQRCIALRRACWSRITRDLRTAPSSELWRHTADLLYLLENPVVREAFFPSGAQRYAVERARPADGAAIVTIADRHDGSVAGRAAATWWRSAPDCFSVARDRNGNLEAYYLMFEATRLAATLAADDPVLTQWAAHLAANPVFPNERVLFLRRWLSRVEGEAPCGAQAACWLDIKRAYMTYRPQLRRVYLTLRDLTPYAAAATELGFIVLDDCAAMIGTDRYATAMLDFGPDSVDGWFAQLVAAELGIVTSKLLDVGARELICGARREPLTRREFDTMHYLLQHTGEIVHRDDIIFNVWGEGADVASNVVDVVVRALRKKLDQRANLIETISGVGYRLRNDDPD